MAGLPPIVLIIAVAALSALAGAVLTWLVIYLTRDRGPNKPPSKSTTSNDSSADMLRVVASKSGPTVLIRGERRQHLRDIRDRETGEEAVAAVKAVLAFAEGWLPALRAHRQISQPDEVSSPGSTTRSTHPRPESVVRSSPGASGSPPDPLRLVEEIDALLQSRLAQHPQFAQEGIRLTRDVNGRLLIYIGRDRYRSPAEIPDGEIATFIRETIRIWERQ